MKKPATRREMVSAMPAGVDGIFSFTGLPLLVSIGTQTETDTPVMSMQRQLRS